MKPSGVIEAIRADNMSGAQSITGRAGSIVQERIRTGSEDLESLQAELLKLAPELINAQPAMASIFNLFNMLMFELDGGSPGADGATVLSRRTDAFCRAMEHHNHAIATQACSVISNGASIFTHSDSSTLRAALQCIHEAERPCHVFCSESRPACEGSRLARALHEKGIHTSLVTDSLIFSLLQQRRTRSVVLVGADAITARGIINKAGTLGLAVAARMWGVPMYVLAGSEKFLPAAFFPREAIQDKPPEEILPDPPPGLQVINRYFDVTPLDCVTAVISESGIATPVDLIETLQGLRAHPGLVAVL